MTYEEIIVAREGPVARVTLNRPAKLNALTAAMMGELRHCWAELAADADLRCVVVTGAGRGFCAGADVELLASDRADAAREVADELAFLPGDRLDVPVIAAVNGPCSGGGLHFVADADIAIASASARFSDPHVNVGAVAGLEPASLLLRMRPDALRRMVLLGRHGTLDAEQARAAGLVSEVTADDALTVRAGELAAAIATGSPTAIAVTRRLLRTAEHRLIRESLEDGWSAIRAHWSHPDAGEGPAAFAERRTPRWARRSQPSD